MQTIVLIASNASAFLYSSNIKGPEEIAHGSPSKTFPSILCALLPIIIVISVNFLMALVILPQLDLVLFSRRKMGTDFSFCGEWRMGSYYRVKHCNFCGDYSYALDSLGSIYLALAEQYNIAPAL